MGGSEKPSARLYKGVGSHASGGHGIRGNELERCHIGGGEARLAIVRIIAKLHHSGLVQLHGLILISRAVLVLLVLVLRQGVEVEVLLIRLLLQVQRIAMHLAGLAAPPAFVDIGVHGDAVEGLVGAVGLIWRLRRQAILLLPIVGVHDGDVVQGGSC